jgi:Zn-dependent oligopeptidase
MELLDYSNLTKIDLENIVTKYINTYENLLNHLANIPIQNLKWDSLIQPLIYIDNDSIELAKLNMKDFYVQEEIREACNDLETQLSQFKIDQEMHKGYFQKFSYYYKNVAFQEDLTPEQYKYLEKVNNNYKKIGMYLDDNKYNRVKEISKELEELCDQFNMNINNENTKFELTKEELVGLPKNYLESRQSNGKYTITLKYPDYLPLMEYCQNREIRKKICTEYMSRCKYENNKLAKKIFILRKELAELFGYDKYSDYVLEDKMAKNTETVMSFLNDILEKIRPKLKNDLEDLANLANQDNITDIQLYDIAYYSRIYTESKLNITKEEIKKMFSINKVISGMFAIYSKLLSYKIVENTENSHKMWHSSVKLYNVYNLENQLIGYFYLDLFPRDGKYSHAACFDIISKSINTKPVAIMACNFDKDNLTFDEVETLFHEFGHVMHHLSARCTLSSLSSFGCEMDFVETPSQLFEEWCYVPQTLKMMSNENITDEIIEKIILSRNILQGYGYARQLTFALYDMDVHGSTNYNNEPAEHYNKFLKEIVGISSIEGTNSIASFGHLFGGYDAGYYGYLWSQVYAKDLFTKFVSKELDEHIGEQLKQTVLSWGGIRSSMDSMTEFLDRKPNSDYFINSL